MGKVVEDEATKRPQAKAAQSREKKRKSKKHHDAFDIISDKLVQGEEVIIQAQISEYIFWKATVVGVFSLFVMLFLVFEIGVLLLVAALIMFAVAAAKRSIMVLALTNKRILVRYGLLMVDVVDIRHDKIESIELERMLTGFLMGYSNVVVMGTGNRYIVIPYVANGPQIRRKYNEVIIGDDEEKDKSQKTSNEE